VHIDVQGSSELPQSHCRNPILAALVFLNLLQPHATGQANGRLRQTKLTPSAAKPPANVLIYDCHAHSRALALLLDRPCSNWHLAAERAINGLRTPQLPRIEIVNFNLEPHIPTWCIDERSGFLPMGVSSPGPKRAPVGRPAQ